MKTDIAIRVENLGKRYRIGQCERHDTLRDAITDKIKAPFCRIKDCLSSNEGNHDQSYIWALKDVSFEIQQGEVVGVIGRNGSGKSTLLKILSRITIPTEGTAEIHGRIGSLLEVGTGFHPELTGRENIFLSGSILGMKKYEIEDKFDDIVKFSEIETFLDTAVKRYSSGMYVRLAFAVAAHLDPEILLVDEVLAVGDAAFQKKCMGKISDISEKGRTVIFVSHNMNAVHELCQRAILLDKGRKRVEGSALEVINVYLSKDNSRSSVDLDKIPHKGKQKYAFLRKLTLLNGDHRPTTVFVMKKAFIAQIELECIQHMRDAEIGLTISSRYGTAIHYLTSTWEGLRGDLEPGRYNFEVRVPEILLFPGKYQVDLWALREGEDSDDIIYEVTYFDVVKGDVTGFPTTIDKYALSGCEVYTSSSWRIIEQKAQ